MLPSWNQGHSYKRGRVPDGQLVGVYEAGRHLSTFLSTLNNQNDPSNSFGSMRYKILFNHDNQ